MDENVTTQTPEEKMSAWMSWLISPRGGNNFWGRILNGCDSRPIPGLGTMGVKLSRRGHYSFGWDPEFVRDLPDAYGMMVLVHEAAHLAYCHIERALKFRRLAVSDRQHAYMHPIYNIAMDMVANDIAVRPLFKDPKIQGGIYADRFLLPEVISPGVGQRRSYPVGRSFDEYVALLMEDLQKSKDEEEEESEEEESEEEESEEEESEEDEYGDEEESEEGEPKYPKWFQEELEKRHPEIDWEESFDDASEGEIERAVSQAHRETQGLIKRALELHSKGCGSLPGGIREVIDELLKEPTVPWQQVLHDYIRSSIPGKMSGSMTLPLMALLPCEEYSPYPGTQLDMEFGIYAFFDTSGSMSNQDFKDCCSELARIVKEIEGASVRLIMFDAGLQHEQTVDEHDEDFRSLRAKARYGYGGTSFEEPMRCLAGVDTDSDWVAGAERLRRQPAPADLGIIFTDGYAPIPDEFPQVPLLWCLTKGGREDIQMTRVVRMGN